MAKVRMPIGDATEVMDTLYPFFRLPEEGFEVVVAGPEARTWHDYRTEFMKQLSKGFGPWGRRAPKPKRFADLKG